MDSNFKVLTNVKKSNLRAPVIQNRFRKLTLNLPDKSKPSTSTKPQFSQPKQPHNDIPTVPRISQPKNSETSLTNKLMLSSSSNTTEANTNEEQTEFVNIETELFTEPLQLSDTEENDSPKRNVNNDDDLVTENRNLDVSQRRVSSDMFSQSTESSKSDFYLPPNRVVSNKDESIDSISQGITNINMSDTRNDSARDTQPNTPTQADTVPNTQQENVHSSSLLTSDDSDSSRPNSSQSVVHESAYLLNVASAKKSPAKNLSTSKSSESKSKNGPNIDTLSNASPISLSSDSEDNENGNDSVVTDDDIDESDVIELLSSDDDEAEKDLSRLVSTLNTREAEISETVVQKLNHFFDNIPVQTSVNSYEKNINLDKNNEINSNKAAGVASEINVSETNASNNDVIDLDESDECVSEQVTSQREQNNKTVISSSIESVDKNESASKPNNRQNDRTLESQFNLLEICPTKINFSANIKINIHLSASSSDTESSSDYVNSCQQKDATEKSKSKESTGSESSFEQNTGEDHFRKIDTDTHTTGSHGSDVSSEIGSMRNTEFKNHQIDESRNEILLSDASSVIESSQVFSEKKPLSLVLTNDGSNSSRPNANQKVYESTNVSKDEPKVTSTKKAPAPNSSTPKKPIDEDCDDDNRPEINEVGQKILNELYGDDWKTPQMVKKCQPVRSTYFTVIPKLNNTHDFSLFEREVASDLESTRITPAPSNEQITNKRTEESQKTSKPISVKSAGCSEQVDSINNEHEDSSRILRSGRKVQVNRILDFSSDEDKLSGNDDYSDDSFKLSNEEQSDESDVSETKPTSKPISKATRSGTKTTRKKKSELVYLDLTHDEVIEDEDHIDPDASSEDLEAISSKFLMSLEYKTAIQTPMPKKQPIPSIRTKRKLFTPNYDNETPFEDNKTPLKTPTNVDRKTVKLKTPIPTYLIPPQFRELGRINEIDDENTIPKATPINMPKSVNRKQTPIVPSSASRKICGFLESLNAKMIPDRYCHPDALRLRSNFKQYRNELTDRLVKIYNDKVFENMLGDIVVTWNKTLRKTAGICKYRRRNASRTFTVELSEKVLTESDRLRDTFIHELCHAAAWVFDGDTGHGNSWKKWTKKAMERLPELPEIKVCHNYSIDYKYTYKCSMCGLKSHAHSKSKKIENIRCSNCHGAIEVYLNKKDKDGKVTLVPPKEASGFAKFVKENYKLHKVPGSVHANIMKLLGSDFSKLTVQEKLKYK